MKGYSLSVRYMIMILIAITAVLVVAAIFRGNIGAFESFSIDSLGVFVK